MRLKMPDIIDSFSLSDFKDLGHKVEQGALVLLDVDDTLITPRSAMFRYNSGHHQFIDELKKQPPHGINVTTILANWRLQRQVILVEEEWPHFIHFLRDVRGVTVYGFTQMHTGAFGTIASVEKWRFQELQDKGIVFTSAIDGSSRLVLLEGEEGYACFDRGILFTGPFTKRQLLDAFLTITPHQPRQIFYVDDRLEQVHMIAQLAQRRNIPFFGVHYRGASMLKGDPKPNVIAYQQKCLLEKGIWLEDEQAEHILNQKSPCG